MPPRRKNQKNNQKVNNKSAQSKKQVATKEYVVNKLKREIEHKYLDINEVPVNIVLGTGFMERLTSISQGQTDITRVGDKATLTSLNLKYQITGGDATNLLRVIVYQWHPNSTLAAPTAANVMQYFNIGDNREVLSPYTHDYKGQFTILFDRLHSTTLVGSNQAISWQGYVSLRRARKQLEFTAGGQEAANHIYLLVLGDSTAVTHPTFTYLARVMFTDA